MWGRKNVLTPIRTTVSDSLGQLEGPRLKLLNVRIPEETTDSAHFLSDVCVRKRGGCQGFINQDNDSAQSKRVIGFPSDEIFTSRFSSHVA